MTRAPISTRSVASAQAASIGPALEVPAVGVAVERVEVVPREHHVGADLLGLRAGAADVGVVGVLRLQLHPDADRPLTAQGRTSWPLATMVRPDSVTTKPRASSRSRSTPMVVFSGT